MELAESKLKGFVVVHDPSAAQGGACHALELLENGDLLVQVVNGPLDGKNVVIPAGCFAYIPPN